MTDTWNVREQFAVLWETPSWPPFIDMDRQELSRTVKEVMNREVRLVASRILGWKINSTVRDDETGLESIAPTFHVASTFSCLCDLADGFRTSLG